MTTSATCYHCGSAVPANAPWQIRLGDTSRPMCCPGCEAVAHAIVQGGLERYYQQRTEMPEKPAEQTLKIDRWAYFDQPDHQQEWISAEQATGQASATLSVEGITCNACGWLIEHHLNALEGVATSAVDLNHHRLTVSWHPENLTLSRLLAELAAIGYRALPFTPDPVQEHLQAKKRRAFKHLVVAAISLAGTALLALYHSLDEPGRSSPLPPGWLALALSSVLMLTATPFFHRALGDLKRRRPGPMVPVSLALISAYLASGYAALMHGGEPALGAIALLVTFLLLTRYLTLRYALKAARQRALPTFATRLDGTMTSGEASERLIPANTLAPGDCIMVKAGERFPVDGEITQGESSLDESRLNGELLPAARRPGDEVLCGTLNLENPLIIRVSRAGGQTRAALINTHIQTAWRAGHLVATSIPQVHAWVACLLLVTALATGLHWGTLQALNVLVCMLVAGSPLALALAAPSALMAAFRQLGKRGVWITHPSTLLSLAHLPHAPPAPIASRADILMLSPRAGRTEEVLAIAHLAQRCIRQNRCIALGVNLVLLVLAALGYLSSTGAAAGITASALAVFGNTQRLLSRSIFSTR